MYGLSKVVLDYKKYCVYDYPAAIASFTVAGSTTYSRYEANIGKVHWAAAEGAMKTFYYCDGGAQALALATVAVAAVSISMV